MLNWVAILRRLLTLYGVKTQQELGMAIGVPFHLKLDGDGQDDTIPWPILELVVAENGLSWDWLLTGKYYRGEAANRNDDPERDDPPPSRPDEPEQTNTGQKPPRVETRELARRLLAQDNGRTAEAEPSEEAPKKEEMQSRQDAIRLRPESEAELESELIGDAPDRDEVVRELENIREAMARELERVESILRDRRPRE